MYFIKINGLNVARWERCKAQQQSTWFVVNFAMLEFCVFWGLFLAIEANLKRRKRVIIVKDVTKCIKSAHETERAFSWSRNLSAASRNKSCEHENKRKTDVAGFTGCGLWERSFLPEYEWTFQQADER